VSEKNVNTLFSRVRFKQDLLSLIRCEVTWEGCVGVGYGDALIASRAREKARGEAWERLWLARIAQSQEGTLSSNGFAAGKTAHDAQVSARMELIERAALLEAWTAPKRWQPVAVSLSTSPLKMALLRALGWHFEAFQILDQDGIRVLAGLLTHSSRGAVFDTSAGFDRAGPLRKLLSSLLRQALLSTSRIEQEHFTLETLPDKADPAAHASFYLNPRHLEAFDLIRKSQDLPSCTLSHIERIQTQMLPTPPGAPFVARATHPDWPALTWGKQSIQGTNPYPHPLA
jgi:hypothetical protein